MKGGVTVNEMARRKQKAANLDAALWWIEGRAESADLIILRAILRQGLPVLPPAADSNALRVDGLAGDVPHRRGVTEESNEPPEFTGEKAL